MDDTLNKFFVISALQMKLYYMARLFLVDIFGTSQENTVQYVAVPECQQIRRIVMPRNLGT